MYAMWNSAKKGQILKKLSRHGPAGTRTLYSPLSKSKRYEHQEILKFALNLQLQTVQILANYDQMIILCLSYFITTFHSLTHVTLIISYRLLGNLRWRFNSNKICSKWCESTGYSFIWWTGKIHRFHIFLKKPSKLEFFKNSCEILLATAFQQTIFPLPMLYFYFSK